MSQAKEVQDVLRNTLERGKSLITSRFGDVRIEMTDGSTLLLLCSMKGEFQSARCIDKDGRFEDEII